MAVHHGDLPDWVTVKVTEIAAPADAQPTPVIEAVAALHRREMTDFFGNDDLVEGPEAMAGHLAAQTTARRVWLAAHEGDELRGAALSTLPLRDNTTVAEVGLGVDPDRELTPIVTALWEALTERLADEGRTVVQLWQMHRDASTDPQVEPLVPATGSGAIVPDRWSELLGELGFTFEQAERHSVLDIEQHRDDWPGLAAEVARHSEGYELLTWSGATADELLGPLAQLRSRMSVDVPSGGLELEEEDWDAERVRLRDGLAISKGRTPLYAAARHRDSGELVAYTELELPSDHPQAAWQEDTLVHADHRGHRLGMAVKLANLDQLARIAAHVQRIHTWNADENEWMLAINVALGFAPVSVEGAWQRHL